MSIIGLVVILCVIGFVAWLVEQLPIEMVIKRIIIGVIIFATIIYILQQFGLIGSLGNLRLK